MKDKQNVRFPSDSHYKVLKNLSIEYVYLRGNYSVLKRIPGLLFVYTSLATVTSSTANVDNSAKTRCGN